MLSLYIFHFISFNLQFMRYVSVCACVLAKQNMLTPLHALCFKRRAAAIFVCRLRGEVGKLKAKGKCIKT